MQMLRKVGIPDPDTRMHSFPHQLSGGMAQRVTVAMALSNNPRLLIADEPTSGLDVTIQAQILDLIQALVDELRSATILITRDLGIIAQHCQEVAVLYAGCVVERAPSEPFSKIRCIPTAKLIKAVATTRRRGRRLMPGVSPSIYELPGGCPLSPRCHLVQPVCRRISEVNRALARPFRPMPCPRGWGYDEADGSGRASGEAFHRCGLRETRCRRSAISPSRSAAPNVGDRGRIRGREKPQSGVASCA